MFTRDPHKNHRAGFFSYFKSVGHGFLEWTFFLLFFFVCLGDLAFADGINGNLEFFYANFDSTTKNETGDTTRITSSSYRQKYNLRLNKGIFPNLRLGAGTLFDKTVTSSKTNETESDITDTLLSPFVTLDLTTPLYRAGVRYNWKEDKNKVSGSPSVSIISEDYRTILGWRPEGFPSMDVRFDRTKNFDKNRSFLDTIEDFYSLDLRYDAIEGLDIRYKPRYRELMDNVNASEEQTLIHDGEARYSNQFFNQRLYLYTGYHFTQTQTKLFSQGATNETSLPLSPFSSLSSIDDTPEDGALGSNPALIDGNLTASAGINIGLPPLGGDDRPRNMGLEFAVATEIDTLYLWVDRDLPDDIADSFAWGIYVSTDNENWTLVQTLASAPFGAFQNRFELQFSTISARFIKVVTQPLQPTVSGASEFPDIFVTELQAFVRTTVASGGEKFTRTFQTYELNGRLKIFDTPLLYYDSSFFFSRSDPSASERLNLSNGFSLSHRFSRIFSGNARIFREDAEEEEERTVSYNYSTTITATPLDTLNTSFSYSGFNGETEEGSYSQNSFFLYATALLYRGISMNFSGGLSFNQQATGKKNENTKLNLGATIAPNSKLTMNVTISDNKTKTSGGNEPDMSASTKRGDFQLSYSPFRTLFLSAGFEVIDDENRTRTTQDYGLNWSPFPEGDLQFFFRYAETLRPEDDQKSRITGPSVIWQISQYFKLDVSYSIIESETVSQETDSNTFKAILKANF